MDPNLAQWLGSAGQVSAALMLAVLIFWLGPKFFRENTEERRAMLAAFVTEQKEQRESCEREAKFQRDLTVSLVAQERAASDRWHEQFMDKQDDHQKSVVEAIDRIRRKD